MALCSSSFRSGLVAPAAAYARTASIQSQGFPSVRVWTGCRHSSALGHTADRCSSVRCPRPQGGNTWGLPTLRVRARAGEEKVKEKEKEKEKKAKKEVISNGKSESDSDGPYPKTDWSGIRVKGQYVEFVRDKDTTSSEDDKKKKKRGYNYEVELDKLHLELIKLQEYIKAEGLRVVTIFEGRDGAGKGGVIKTITAPLNPRVVSVHALGTPSDREKSQWYFQRYVPHLPAKGEWVIFDRSWYNRAGVEKVMGFCTEEEYQEFMLQCPMFENMLIRSGIILIKYWISVSAGEQEKRFEARLANPEKRWKLSPMDLYARSRWSDYSRAKDIMFQYTDTKLSPWYVVPGDDKKNARLNCIAHTLSKIPYEELPLNEGITIPPLQKDQYVRPPMQEQAHVPQIYS